MPISAHFMETVVRPRVRAILSGPRAEQRDSLLLEVGLYDPALVRAYSIADAMRRRTMMSSLGQGFAGSNASMATIEQANQARTRFELLAISMGIDPEQMRWHVNLIVSNWGLIQQQAA